MRVEKYRVQVVDADYYRKNIKCQDACPVHTDAMGYIKAIAQGEYEQGYIRARQPNPFVSSCGRVCNAPCETACRRGQIDAPVTIRALKRFVCERYGVEAMTYLPIVRTPGVRVSSSLLSDIPPPNSQTVESFGALRKASARGGHRKGKVAVIGCGPAGLAAAHDLATLGHQVTIFEAAPVPGGMLRLGVPEYRLPRNVTGLEIAEILEQGVELKLETRLGERLTLKTLREEGYDAIFIAVGLYRSRELNIEGVNLDGVLRAIEFLLNVNMGYKVELGQKVLVIGGGAVAMDVARTVTRVREPEPLLRDGELTTALGVAREALRRGVPEVHVICLESREEMPALPEEVEDALTEGVILHTRRGPSRILGDGQRVTGLETVEVASVFDSQGRFNPTFIPHTESVLEGDTVILAIGQTSDLSFITPEDGIEITRRGTIAVDPDTLATTAPGIFAGGDVAFGPRNIIAAVCDGHKAALSIDQYLQERRIQVRRRSWMTPVNLEELASFGRLDIPRRRPPALPLERRIGIAEVELGYTPEMAREQASRCLRCNVQTVFNGDRCILCGGCVDICPQNCLKLVRLDKIDGDERLKALVQARYGISWEAFQNGGEALNQGTAMIKDEARCVRCGLCARRCPTGAITMEAFWFEEELVYEGSEERASKEVTVVK
jgi:NADPH-dependent glutamate synthase beta subunit-like oxidoreductase